MQSRRHEKSAGAAHSSHRVRIIRKEIPMDQAGLISVNDIKLSNDLHSATVYVSILGTEPQQKRGMTLLREHRGRLQTSPPQK